MAVTIEEGNKKPLRVTPRPVENRNEGYWILLNKVIDPEMDIGIVDLGLIYDVVIEDGTASVYMTLTSAGCPAGPELTRGVEAAVEQYEGVNHVVVHVVWDPIWTPDMVKDDIRAMLWGEEF